MQLHTYVRVVLQKMQSTIALEIAQITLGAEGWDGVYAELA